MLKFVLIKINDFLFGMSISNSNSHLLKIQKHIKEGKKVVVVAHSQGSLYANLVYKKLSSTEKASVGLVYVGAAASLMEDGTVNYITN